MLEISRADVLGDQLMNYSPEERFIKLPVPPYLELLGIEAIPSQIGIINAINNPKYRFIAGAIDCINKTISVEVALSLKCIKTQFTNNCAVIEKRYWN